MFEKSLRKFRFFAHRAGIPPGSIGEDTEYGSDENTTVTVISYDKSEVQEASFHETDRAGEPQGNVWVRVVGMGDLTQLKSVFTAAGMHPMLFEDVMNPAHEPSSDIHSKRVFISGSAYVGAPKNSYERYSIFHDGTTLYTFESGDGEIFDPLLKRIRDNAGIIRNKDSIYLLYALLDSVADSFFISLDYISEQTESIEEEIMGDPDKSAFSRLYGIKKELLFFKRLVRLTRSALSIISEYGGEGELRYYYADLSAHISQCNEYADTLRDILTGLTDLYLAVSGNKMNEVMKVLTIAGSIFIPLTFIAGIYGMNFEFMPELKIKGAYPVLLIIMSLVAGGMLWFFRKKKWF